MLFNSLNFLLFFVSVAATTFLLPRRFRWVLLLLASYFFYGSWNANYLVLIVLTTITTYTSGLLLASATSRAVKRLYILLVCFINFGVLTLFKYYNFFASSVENGLKMFRLQADLPFLDFLLPVGISFYTFQAIGYVIDVYRDVCSLYLIFPPTGGRPY